MAPRSEDEFLSVVMPVHNALPYLDDAVRSILAQTHSNFEFVIYDDASTDGCRERLREWAACDARIRLIEGERKLGPVGSSALVVQESRAPLVARMDADDLCHPARLALELTVLRENPSAGLVGTLFDIIDGRGRQIRGPDYWRLTRKSPFVPFAAHGSILFRREVFGQVGGYRRECEYWEDQDLVARIASVTDVLVIPRPLYRVRQWIKHPRALASETRVEDAVDLMYRCVARLQEGRAYDDLLAQNHSDAPVRVDPRVFISAGSKILWPGGRPKLVGRLLKRGKLRPDTRTASALIWTTWASLSPGSLRTFIKLLLWSKNRHARWIASSTEPLRWSPRSADRASRDRLLEQDRPPGLVRSTNSR